MTGRYLARGSNRMGKSRGRQEAANLLDSEIDLHVDCTLPQLCRRAARVAQDSVLWAVWPELRLAIDDGITHGRRDQIPAHPCITLVEIHQFRSIKKVTVEADWIAVLRQVLIERIIRGPIDLVTVEHASTSAQLAIELPGDLLVNLRLAATVIAHDDNVAETVEGRLLCDAFEHGGEQLVRDPDGAGNRFCIVRRVGQHGQEDRIAEFSSDRLSRRMRYDVMAAVRVLGASFLDTAGIDERRRLPRRNGALYFHPSHLLEFHLISLGARRGLCGFRSVRRPGGQ